MAFYPSHDRGIDTTAQPRLDATRYLMELELKIPLLKSKPWDTSKCDGRKDWATGWMPTSDSFNSGTLSAPQSALLVLHRKVVDAWIWGCACTAGKRAS
jgi:hypothetical protein